VHERRLVTPVLGRGPSAEKLLPEDAPSEAATLLGRVKEKGKLAVVLGAGMSSEDNFVAARFAKLFGTSRLYLAARDADAIGWKGDAILKNADPNPNRAGATQVAGRDLADLDDLLADVLAGQVSAVVALGHFGGEGEGKLDALKKLDVVLSLASNEGPLPSVASMQIPVASWAETFGTFVNAKGMVQTFVRAIPAPDGVHPAWKTLCAIAKELGLSLAYERTGDVRNDMNAAAAAADAQPQANA